MKALRQAGALILSGLRSIPQRLGASLVTVIGIMTVVAVLTALLSIRVGAQQWAARGVTPGSVIIYSRGAPGVTQSNLPLDALAKIANLPLVKRASDGKPVANGATMYQVDMVKKTNQRSSLFLVGTTDPRGSRKVHLVAGRWFRPGLHEIVVSRTAQQLYRGVRLGDRIPIHGSDWTVVGAFESTGGSQDQAMFTDAATALSAFGRNTYQQIAATLKSPADFAQFKRTLLNDPTLRVDVYTGQESQEKNFKPLYQLLDFVSYFIGALMAMGAVCAALSSLYATVDTRRREIATLRAIGFGATPVVVSVLAEGLLLALGAGIIGALIAWLAFSGKVVSTVGLTFPLAVNLHLVGISIAWALVIGLIGGLLPALRAARLPVATALRAT